MSKPHTLGLSLVHQPDSAHAQVVVTALYDNVGGPLKALALRYFHFEPSVLTGRFALDLYPARLAEVGLEFAEALPGDNLRLFRAAMAMVVWQAWPYERFAAFVLRGNAIPYQLHDDVSGLLPTMTEPHPWATYRLFDTSCVAAKPPLPAPASRVPYLRVVSSR